MGISEQVDEELRRGRSADDVVRWLKQKGMSEATARRFVERAQAGGGAGPRSAPRATARSARAASISTQEAGDGGRWLMARGAFFFVLGVLGTGLTFVLARPGGKALLLYGAIIWGPIDFLRGLARWWQVRESRPFPLLAVGAGVALPAAFAVGLFFVAKEKRATERQEVRQDFVQKVREEESRRGIAPQSDPGASLDPVSAYVVALRHADPATRREGAWRLGEMRARARGAVPDLLGALKDPAPQVREGAAEALMKIDPQNTEVVAAVQTLWQDPSLEVWPRVMTIFAERGDRAALAALTSKLGDLDAGSRAKAAGSLGQAGEHAVSTVPQLLKMFREDRVLVVRMACASALGRLGAGRAEVKEALTAAASSGPPPSRDAAKAALSDLERAERAALLRQAQPQP